ncbi:hypothetical protein FNV43_RR00567 [Rhamnella rubrinervis]|uniref:Uncharacterized protein n=1 Tax=Rhamnella rubrinervis TaxID=2594499 RepID=A0A8K0HQW7_9ROSA|nr:hypothetical protein FNV43_RR00567 [Rhamnella rubrinervis]
MYPEDCSIRCSRIIRQWIAEGFVKEKTNRRLEEVAYDYLTELINRSLVQVSKVYDTTGKVRECRIHDLMPEVVLRKMEDSSFCHVFSENQFTFREGQVTRRLSFVQTSFDVVRNADKNSHVRSILYFNIGDGILLDMSILITRTKNFKLSKVLDFEDGPLTRVHEDVGNLFHLRYLSLRNTKVKMLPRSIGKLVNLETLDLKQSFVFEIPGEIYRLCKLQHLLGYNRDYTVSMCIDSIKVGDDPLKILKSQHNLVVLQFEDNAYDGEKLQFEKGVFPKLKFLKLRNLNGLNSIIIEKGALSNLEHLQIAPCPHMEEVPFGVYHLETLKYLRVFDLPDEFVDGMRPEGQHRHIVEHIPFVHFVKGFDVDDFKYK